MVVRIGSVVGAMAYLGNAPVDVVFSLGQVEVSSDSEVDFSDF